MLPYFYPSAFDGEELHAEIKTEGERSMRRLKSGLEFADKYAMKAYVSNKLLERMK